MSEQIIERFLAKIEVDPDTGCWLWTASLDRRGYGKFGLSRRTRLAHRVSYEIFVGEAPRLLDHICHDPLECQASPCVHRRCVNPDHLQESTIARNSGPGRSRSQFNGWWHRAKRLCPSGHPYDDENTYINPNSRARVCRQCTRDAKARYRARKKTAV